MFFKQSLLKLETCKISFSAVMRIRYFVDFYAKFFFWFRSENRSLGTEQFALPRLRSKSWHSCSEFKFGFSWVGEGSSVKKKKRKGIRHPQGKTYITLKSEIQNKSLLLLVEEKKWTWLGRDRNPSRGGGRGCAAEGGRTAQTSLAPQGRTGSVRAIRGAPAARGRALSASICAVTGRAKPEPSPQEARPVNPYCFDSCTHLEIMQNAI